MKIYEWLKSLTYYGAGEAADAEEGGAFFDDEDDADDADESTEDDGQSDESEDLDDEDEDFNHFDELGDDDEEDDDDDESDEDEDADEDAESEDDPESAGEGGEDGGAVANALRQAIRARLTAEKAQSNAPEGVTVDIPTVEDLRKVEGLEEIHETDLKTIHAIASAVVQNAITSFNANAVAPMRTAVSEEKRKNQIVANLNNFNRKYPEALDTHQDQMAVVWDEFSDEFGRDLADSISFEDLYIMAGGKGKAAASKKVKGVAKKLATDQKKKSVKSQRQAGRIAKVRSGGKRKGRKGEEVLRQTERHIRKTNFTPFVIR